jgi:hypothetical protein
MSGGAKGIGLGIDFAIGNQYKRKGGKSYIDPAVLSSVVSVISTYGKTNEDADRSILKDKTGKGNDFKLLNFGFAGNSGYGLYHTNFSDWNKSSVSDFIKYLTNNSFHVINSDSSATKRVIYQNTSSSTPDIKGFKIKVEIIKGGGYYRYFDNTGHLRFFPIQESGIYELPTSYSSAMSGENFIGFTIDTNSEYKLEQLPDFEGWLCTDGVDDMIVSEKTVGEMIGDSKECTVISIISYISDIGSNHANILGKRFIRNMFERDGINGKYYICGYTSTNIDEIGNVTVVNDILGDKTDFVASYPIASGVADYFSVTGYLNTDNVPQKCIKIAYAGGFIANKVLTTDEINQIIAYFNLDRPGQIIKPQLYCNIKKQGITNDNHAEFNDQLIDFVGGHNIQLNNIGWEGESGINSYPVVFGNNKTWTTLRSNSNNANYEVTSNVIKIYKSDNAAAILYSYVYNNGISRSYNIPSFKLRITGLKEGQSMRYKYVSESDKTTVSVMTIVKDDTYDMPRSYPIEPNESTPNGSWIGFITDIKDDYNVTLEVFPTIENALCLDGISDFGKATGLPILKDYTICALRKWLYGDSVKSTETGSIVSKSKVGNDGAFILEQTFNRNPSRSSTFSFGTINSLMSNDKLNEESFTYQTKYSYNGETIVSGSGVDIDSMWLGTIRDGDSRFSKLALWSLMLFPYSLSEFLLERQLRKYKAGTLYPDMIEFRPIVKSNIPYLRILYFITSTGDQIIKGSYIPIGSVIQINIQTVNATDEISSVSVNGKEVDMYNKDETYWRYRFKVTKSPQKISIVISSYLTMLGNDTLISNETLIKNK